MGQGRCPSKHEYPTKSGRTASVLSATLCQPGSMDDPKLPRPDPREGTVVGGGGGGNYLQVGNQR